MKTITIDGIEYTPRYPSADEVIAYVAYLRLLAQETYNPYPALYEKIKFLPEADRKIAITQMMSRDYPVPDFYVDQAVTKPAAVNWLVEIVLGQPIVAAVTPENSWAFVQACALYMHPPKLVTREFAGTPAEQAAAYAKLKETQNGGERPIHKP